MSLALEAPRRKRCCSCNALCNLLCDWKLTDAIGNAGAKASGSSTCDAPICNRCALQVGPDKHLCLEHARAWRARPRFRP